MLNIDDFIKRLEIILEYYNLSASAFADKIGVQRSSLSHLLSGRNKPSLDFVIKIVEVFPEVDLYWILNGKGDFPKSEIASTTILKNEIDEEIKTTDVNTSSEPNLFSNFEKNTAVVNSDNHEQELTRTNTIAPDEIDRIVIFFKNGTFKNYRP